MLVEVCCNSLESALNAQKAGADRIELCCELGVGGITPSYGLIKLVKERLAIPIHVLIRPRSGHFTYSDLEFEVILNEIEVCKNIGVDGVVCGILMSDGEIDIERTKRIIENTKPLHFTFHRAFDWIKNQENALLQLERLGVDTILTSGKQINAKSGFKVLTKLNKLAKVITIMPGGGINPENCTDFKSTGFKAIHFSATSFKEAISLEGKLSMNSIKHLKEDQVVVTNESIVRQIVKTVK